MKINTRGERFLKSYFETFLIKVSIRKKPLENAEIILARSTLVFRLSLFWADFCLLSQLLQYISFFVFNEKSP